jgi:hypothetical protein
LWEEECSTDSIINVAASQVLCWVCLVVGFDELGQQLFLQGRQMAERLSLIGVEHSASLAVTFDALPMSQKRAATFAAWGIYNWHS